MFNTILNTPLLISGTTAPVALETLKTLTVSSCVQFFGKRAHKRQKRAHKRQKRAKYLKIGQKYTKLENNFKKCRWLRAIIARNKLLEEVRLSHNSEDKWSLFMAGSYVPILEINKKVTLSRCNTSLSFISFLKTERRLM